MTPQFDVAVIGLGAMGSAALSHLAARGVQAIGIDAYYPAHTLGSSHGDSRLIRLGYFEDPSYVPLLQRAYANWRALEGRLRSEVLTITGVLQIGAPDSTIVTGTRASCKLHDLTIEELDRAAMKARFPVFSLDAGEIALLDPQGGYIRPEAAVAGYIRLAAEDGAVLHFGEKVTGIEPDDAGVTVTSAVGKYRANKVIVATGSWISELVPQLKEHAVPIRQVVAWYQPRDGFVTQPQRMPAFIRDEGDDGSYFGFPAIGVDGVKIGRHAHFREPIDPNEPNPPVNDADTALLDAFIARRLPAANGLRVNAITCRYTMLPSEDFLIDLMPGNPRIVVASPCSGHGFKFTSVIGEILADLALDGRTDLPISAFSFGTMERFLAARK
ncbi:MULTISPECIES: N-methyl-L-tryptophan oxidase [Rhizobium]|uniref:N-methyl-L-tryptophan oxidase n=1 Tax=Rhizobium rhododendri TaxID=2506430 RepID=A0ABY8ISP8_9HYPH|nr:MULTISPECIES: N-methyl-L-tryptophan oxidase [Rhizobium]MBO9100732.1 N-methyl-L-tryptophan oxidase [Rhizobium sp. L58/93]MBO9171216.1 N-methyl-L-tryptophan oxidase [Rhizobium sp. L245/93]MBO9187085.1 N-methyl-L-tryptophan oxidase [Rhizobium sp. E27B/91]MBZ5759534.1 N-methyl-L-tryptophan oxidase [Rhizobium sp. VS19-DR96]MBZ5765733.1 N-methyl-L-tryptophan oxidase [Rhizobium sp. VS19-DR129.2]